MRVTVEIWLPPRAWKGGRAPSSGSAPGGPGKPNPRLTDLRTSSKAGRGRGVRRARKESRPHVREDILKENSDGEALLWAHTRMMGAQRGTQDPHGDRRRPPGDRSTMSVNPGNYLERNLRDSSNGSRPARRSAHRHRGIGHDVTPLLSPRSSHHRRRRPAGRHDEEQLASRSKRKRRRRVATDGRGPGGAKGAGGRGPTRRMRTASPGPFDGSPARRA